MTKEDIDKLLVGRKIIEKHRERDRKNETKENRSNNTLKMLAELKAFGFDSVDEFSRWNDSMNLEAFKEGHPIEGECDLCVGVPSEQVCCILSFGAHACFYQKYKGVPDDIYFWSLQKYVAGKLYTTPDGLVKWTEKGCPPDHGYYTIASKKNENWPFDIGWRV